MGFEKSLAKTYERSVCMTINPEVCVLRAPGTNCDEEMSYAFEYVGSNPRTTHINELANGDVDLRDFDILALPGGFSYGDDISSGTVLSIELSKRLGDQIKEFVDAGKPIFGVCNGFQVLVKMGLLPGNRPGLTSGEAGDERQMRRQNASLVTNDNGAFVRKYVELAVDDSECPLIPDDMPLTASMEVAHGEGRFVAPDNMLGDLVNNGQAVFKYLLGQNPNGSKRNIAGVCSPSGLILGMMPHPERLIASRHDDVRKHEAAQHAAQLLFKGIVDYARKS